MNYEDLKHALEEGILLVVKWGLLVAVIVYAYAFSVNTRQMAFNGQQAAVMIRALQEKGWLPQVVDGQIPDKK